MRFKKGDIIYYKVRLVFADGHITRSSFPDLVIPQGTNDRINLPVIVPNDLDGTSLPIVELYRRVNEGLFYLVERVRPSENTLIEKTGATQWSTPDGNPLTVEPTQTYFDASTNTVTFVDSGEGGTITPLQDVNNIYPLKAKAQTTARDRVILGNITYRDVDTYPVNASGKKTQLYTISKDESEAEFATLTEDNTVYPPNVNVQLYGKAKYNDGTESVHFPVSEPVGTTQLTQSVSFSKVNSVGLKNDTDITELGLYLNYKQNLEETTNTITFDTNEIANANVQTLASLYGNEPDNFPNIPRVWVGFKYIIVERVVGFFGADTTPTPGSEAFIARVNDASRNQTKKTGDQIEPEDQRVGWWVTDNIGDWGLGSVSNPNPPDSIDVSLIGAKKQTYHLVALDTAPNYEYFTNDIPQSFTDGLLSRLPSTPTSWAVTHRYLYKLAISDALATAAETNSLRIRPIDTIGFSGSEISDIKLSKEWTQVVGFIDETYGFDPNLKGGFGIPERNNLYLLLPSDSIWSKISQGAQTYEYSPQPWSYQPWESSQPNLNAVGTIEVDGLQTYVTSPDAYNTGGTRSVRNQWMYGVAYRDYSELEGLIYVGKVDYPGFTKSDEVFDVLENKLLYNGYEFVKENFLLRTSLRSTNLYEKLNLTNNLRASQNVFKNQIIFSEPATEDLYSGSRIFDYKSFVDVSSDHGEILGLHSYRSVIFIFTERAVGIIRVGEALTRTASGETFVNTEEFLSSPEWILTNVKGYYDKSICEVESGFYFSDGRDLYVYNGQLQNLTQGVINIEGGDPAIIGYDPVHREILLTTSANPRITYAYSLELQQWYGPYTYAPQASFTYKGDYYSIMTGEIVKHNVGNDFADLPYATRIDGGANDFGDATTVKTYRKMLLESNTNTIDVLYSHNYNLDHLETNKKGNIVSLNTATNTADYGDGILRVGLKNYTDTVSDPVDPDTDTERVNLNSRSFFWRVKSNVENFVLRLVGLDFFIRGRR